MLELGPVLRIEVISGDYSLIQSMPLGLLLTTRHILGLHEQHIATAIYPLKSYLIYMYIAFAQYSREGFHKVTLFINCPLNKYYKHLVSGQVLGISRFLDIDPIPGRKRTL